MNRTQSIDRTLAQINPTERGTVGKHLIAADATLLTAMEALNRLSGDTMTLFVVDNNGKLTGSVTDGDIRRALLSGSELGTYVKDACRENCMVVTAGGNESLQVSQARKRGVNLVPIVKDGYIKSLIDLTKTKGYLPIDAVMMAGGAGERLRPLTLKTPKPLLPIGGKAIIDYNIEELIRNNIKKIYITVNYLGEMIKEHVKKNWNTSGEERVVCIREPFKTGTIGSLQLIDETLSEDLIVMNSDLLTDINFEEMYLRHVANGAELTVAVTPYSVSVPFAIVEHEGERVKRLTEKPTFNYYVNAGIYIMKRDALRHIPKGEYFDATDLIDKLLEEGKKVCQYEIEGKWIDIGSPDDYRHACKTIETI